MVQIMLVLEVLFTQDSEVEDLNPACPSAIIFSLGFKPIQDNFARMTDEAGSSVVLAELQVALFRECNNQRLSPWGRPFSCSPDPVTDLLKHLSWSPRQLEQILLYIINSGRLPLFQ